MDSIKIKRAYDPTIEEGYRVLVDRFWPRGVKKESLKLDAWNKDVAPSGDLRRWFDHRRDRFNEFSKRYRKELDASEKAHDFKKQMMEKREEEPVWLIYGAKDEECNHARVLKEWLEDE